MRVFGITGWKNSGKTGLVERLVVDCVARGLTVSTVKHAHHQFDVDHTGKDSFRHRQAGASEVLLSSANRWALMNERRNEPEPSLEELLARLSPVDLILVEGFKRDRHPKIETHRAKTGQALIAPEDRTILAVASDSKPKLDRPVFDLNATSIIADFMLERVGL